MNAPKRQSEQPVERPTLRVYAPEQDLQQDERKLQGQDGVPTDGHSFVDDCPTLRDVFEQRLRPRLLAKGRAKATIGDIDRAIRVWDEYWQSTRISDPQLIKLVTLGNLETFQEYLQGRGLSASTINGYLGAVRQVLIAGERHGLITQRPRAEKLPESAAPKWYLTHDQIKQIWNAMAHATWPGSHGLSPGDWWRCWLVLMWTYGFRTQELYAFEPDHAGLTWASLSLQAETPNPHGTATNAEGWLSYTPQKQKWAKPEPLFLPLTESARWAVDRLPKSDDPAAAVFPWPSCNRSFYGTWRVIQERAGVTNKQGGRYCVKHLRKTASTYLDTHYRGLGAAVLGHAERGDSHVNSRHYTATERMFVQQMRTYPVPDCFSQIRRPSGQMELF